MLLPIGESVKICGKGMLEETVSSVYGTARAVSGKPVRKVKERRDTLIPTVEPEELLVICLDDSRG